MNASSIVPSLIRTYVPLGVGAVASWLAAKGLGLDAQTQTAVVVLLTSVLTALYYTGVRILEKRYPAIGTVFLGLGLKAKPAYAKPGDPAVHPMGDRAPVPPRRP